MKIENNKKPYGLYAAAMLIPCVYLLVWQLIQGHGFLTALPYYSDELGYWRIMFSIDNCGFGFGAGGGFAGNSAAIGPLGSHGLSPLLAWGWYALLFTWRENSLFAANFVMLTVSIGVFMFTVKPDTKRTLALSALLLLYAPLFLYINTAMMEVPCAAAIIVYTALYTRWRETRGKGVFAAALILGVYLGVLRICYMILLLPLLWEKWGFGFEIKTLAKIAVLGVCTLALYKVTSLFITPYPDVFTVVISKLPFKNMLSALLWHTLRNIRIYFSGLFPLNAESAFRWLYLGSLAFFLYKSFAKGEKKRLYLSFFAVFAVMLAANIVLYDVYGWLDYRAMSPMLIFALMFVLTDADSGKGVRIAFVSAVAAMLIVTFCTVIPDGTFVHEERFEKIPDRRAEFAEVFGEEKASVSVMCEDGVFARLRDIPPQIGVKWMKDEGGVITSDTEFIMIGGDDREVSGEYEFVGKPADKCYVYKRTGNG